MRSTAIDVLGLRIRVLESGEASLGDPVVLIHGVGAWAENWRAVMDPIAASGRRAIALDLPGFGESERPGDVRHFGPQDAFYPRFMLAFLDALGIASAHVVGSSLGGAVAYTIAVTAPERVRSLALLAAGGIGREVALYLRLATLPGSVTLVRLVGRRSDAHAVLRSCFYDPRTIPATLYEEVERYGLRSYDEFVRALRAGVTITGVRRDLRAHWLGQADRYRGPVLVLWGREDRVLPVAHLAEAKGVFPQAEVHIVERCGHLPMIEQPDAVLSALLPFIANAEELAAA